MGKLAKATVVIAIILALGGLSNSPGHATVSGDINAGLPLSQVITNGLAAGMSLDAIMDQALQAGADVCALEKAAIALNIDLPQIFKTLSDVCSANQAANPNLSLAASCSPCSLMNCAVASGIDQVTAANAEMAAGGDLQQVRDCLAGMGYPGADTYAYSPPGPPLGPTFPGGGGGGKFPLPPPPPASPAS